MQCVYANISIYIIPDPHTNTCSLLLHWDEMISHTNTEIYSKIKLSNQSVMCWFRPGWRFFLQINEHLKTLSNLMEEERWRQDRVKVAKNFGLFSKRIGHN